ncbi:unnamed protein product [Protopolystoma xenopodis]|uniref:Uncharacterized protein n=1 Tax=Protopolystoma xenopodis TaxID=117903 RepID=A0A3S5CIB9_9PLAT|nr:unnamed protein product [Protopolystoma xenopodis]
MWRTAFDLEYIHIACFKPTSSLLGSFQRGRRGLSRGYCWHDLGRNARQQIVGIHHHSLEIHFETSNFSLSLLRTCKNFGENQQHLSTIGSTIQLETIAFSANLLLSVQRLIQNGHEMQYFPSNNQGEL